VRQNRVGGQRWFSLFGHFNLLIILMSTALCAQSFENFKKVPIKVFSHDKNIKETAYLSYFKRPWDEYKAQGVHKLYETSKSHTLLSTKEKKATSVGPKIYLKLPTLKELSHKNTTLDKAILFHFYGTTVGFSASNFIKNIRYFPHNQEGIVRYFKTMLESDYILNLKEIEATKEELNLNDWGVYLLVKQLAQQIYTNEDEVRLFSWFMLNKMGYDVKVGLFGMRVVTLFYSKNTLYNVPSFRFTNKTYYALEYNANDKLERIYTYEKSFPLAEKALNLQLLVLPKLALNLKTKNISFEYLDEKYMLSYEYNQNIIDFMATYPQVDVKVFFNAPMEERTYLSLAKGLKQYVDTKHASEGIDFVLHFVQKAFKYEVDDLQFSQQKTMFAEEALYYNKSDCEDRAVLFAYLVKKLFGISSVGVLYSNYMTTALYIPMKGDSVPVGKRRFVIADPSYINANIGDLMENYRALKVKKIISLKKEH